MTAIASARAQLHGIVREALVPLALYLIQKECHGNDPFNLEDIFRGDRERARYLDPHMEASAPSKWSVAPALGALHLSHS